MKKQILISLILLFSITMSAQVSNNKYDNDWKLVTQYEKQSLPKSATKQVDLILQKAISDKNNTQVIKALIYKNKYKRDIDSSDNEGLFHDLDSLAKQTSDIAEKSLLHSMLAELYVNYYQNDQWSIRQRTNLADLVPEDMKEWSSNIFKNKIIENIDLSIKDATALKGKTTKDYSDIILLGTDGQKYYPTLYDFLMQRATYIAESIQSIENQEFDLSSTGFSIEQLTAPADEYIKLNISTDAAKSQPVFLYYQQFLKELLSRDLRSTAALTDIDRIEYLSRYSRSFSGEKRLETYTNLYKKYESSEVSTEIIDKITDAYNYGLPNLSGREVNKAIYDWLNKGIDKYPTSYGASLLRAKKDQMETPVLNTVGNSLQYPDSLTKLNIIHKNIQALSTKPKFTLYKVEKGRYNIVKEYPLNLVSAMTYYEDTLSVDLGNLPVGKYCFSTLSKTALDNPPKNSSTRDNRYDFVVSHLISFSRNSGLHEYEIFVVDRISGKPMKDVSISIYPQEGDRKIKKTGLIETLKTNEVGLAVYKDKLHLDDFNSYYVASYKVALGNDSCLSAMNLNGNNYRWTGVQTKTDTQPAISVFNDRSIYRPGQTAYFKAIVIGPDSKPLANKAYTAQLYDANNEVVAKKEIITNEFGSISGEFIIPQSGLLGSYRIAVDKVSCYFSVEEYKRPTFEITFDKVDKTYTFGEEVKLKGYAKNFSGISLQDADVKYSIMREQFNFWWRSGERSQFADGTVKTNDDGSFEITFTPQAGDGNRALLRMANDRQIYTFSVTATVTDINGETQSNSYDLVVGNVSMVINIDLPEQIEKSQDYKLSIDARNLQAQNIESSGTYAIYMLNELDSVQNKVQEGSFKTGEQTELKNKIKSLASGKYQIQVKALDDKKNEVSEKKNFIIFSYADKKPPIKTSKWLVQKNLIFGKDNKPVEVIFGTTDKEMYVLYQLSDNDKVFERKIIKLSDRNELFTIPYKAEYGDKINMSFTSVKDGEIYNQSFYLTKEIEKQDTNLKVKLEVFRDKLRPGQAETWTVSVKDTTDSPVLAELLASMYDTSLDKLHPYMAWSLDRPYKGERYLYPVFYNFPWYNDGPRWFNLNYKSKTNKIPERTFDQINWFGYTLGYGTIYKALSGRVPGVMVQESAMGNGSVRIRGAATLKKEVAMDQAMPEEGSVLAYAPPAITREEEASTASGGGETSPQIRQNFNETAFFFPQLRTNEKGETLISFTVPESNTTWRFRAFAHDKEARVGVLEQMVVTRKELMVTPNMPRFVRQGDKTSISTKISNLSEGAVSGDVRIEFFDLLSDKVIDLAVANQQQTFSLAKDASTSAAWTFDVPTDIELLGCRIVAQNASFSDGEQHVLAVLPNRMLVTESMPIDVTDKGTSTFTFDKLYNSNSSTIGNYRLTLEYASNPAWYAVQALPTMSNPSNENAVNWFASYYVNTLGSSIVRQYPKVAAMIQAWQKQGGDKQTLVSNLQKNEELKNVLLEETPWVLDAKNETEQMQRLSLLFDLNNTKQQTDAATRKLSELMANEGGWTWYKGLYPSRSITQYILYGYANLQKVGQVEYPEQIKRMQMSALKYIDKQISEDFKNLKKYNKDWQKTTSVSTNQLEFAYVRSSYRDIPIDQEARAAERFYTDVATKNWTKLNLYERSILAVILKRNGDKLTADKIVKSLKEHAVNDKKLGMYWPNNRSNVFMSMSAISVHTFLMESLQENGATEQEMNAMKRWLLMQKQTQVWESSHASIDAISALLSSGSDWFSGETTATVITVGNQKVEPENKETGTGYFKTTWNKSEINKEMGKIEVTTQSADPAYGALYWQYYENLDKITSQKGDLNVEKQLFKENMASTEKNLSQITESSPLAVGDKVIVRLTVRVNKDMEFVQLKDMRAPCFEPEQTTSGTKWANGLIYYQMPKDASTNFYFDRLPKGTYVLEYPVFVNRTGEYSNGITTIQCLYAPQYVSHTQGIKVTVKEK